MSNEHKDNREKVSAEKRRFWQAHIVAWEQSGNSQSAYCRDNNLPLKSFNYWRNKFCDRKPPVTFVPVAVKTPSFPSGGSGTSLKLLTRSGYGIEIGDGFNQETLKKLLNTLAGGV